MLILERLTSRSSRSLAVMTGFARSASGRGHDDPLAGPDAGCRLAAVSDSAARPLPAVSDSPQPVKE
jgi:hypothetical protein